MRIISELPEKEYASFYELLEVHLKHDPLTDTFRYDAGYSDKWFASQFSLKLHAVQNFRKRKFGNLREKVLRELPEKVSRAEFEALKAEMQTVKAALNYRSGIRRSKVETLTNGSAH